MAPSYYNHRLDCIKILSTLDASKISFFKCCQGSQYVLSFNEM